MWVGDEGRVVFLPSVCCGFPGEIFRQIIYLIHVHQCAVCFNLFLIVDVVLPVERVSVLKVEPVIRLHLFVFLGGS